MGLSVLNYADNNIIRIAEDLIDVTPNLVFGGASPSMLPPGNNLVTITNYTGLI